MAKFLFYDSKLINILLEDEKPSGGSSVQNYAWVQGLIKEGHEIYVMTNFRQNDKLKDTCKDINLISFYNRQKGIHILRDPGYCYIPRGIRYLPGKYSNCLYPAYNSQK